MLFEDFYTVVIQSKLLPRLLLLMALSMGVNASTEMTVQDSTGQNVTIKQLPRRVVSLVPHGTELFCLAGGCDRLVAVSANSDAPEQVQQLPHFGPYNAISLEGILSFQPDLVVAWPSGNSPEIITQLERLGIPVFRTDPKTVNQIATDLRSMARLAGSQAGIQVSEQLLHGWNELKRTYASRRPVPVFIHVWDNPLLTLNDQSMVSSALRVCGAYNIFGDLVVKVPRVSKEDVIARKPALIVEGDHDGQRRKTGALKTYWKPFNSIPAVKNGHIYTLNGDDLLRPTPNLLKGAQELCMLIDGARKLME